MNRFAILLPLLVAAACSKPAETPGNAMSATAVASETRKLQLQPGQWETTTLITAMDIAGLPAGATEAATGTRTMTSNCITAADAARPDANILSGTKDGNCTYERFSMTGGSIDAAMTCMPARAPGKIAMTLAGTHARDRFDMGMAMNTSLPGDLAMTMKATVTGRRTGECTNPETGT